MLKLIFHNISKHILTNILIGILLLLLSFYMIIGLNVLFSISSSLKRATADNLTGDLIIAARSVKHLDILNKDGEKKIIPLPNWQKLYRFLQTNEWVAVASPRLRVWSMAWSSKNRLPLILTGVDPSSDPALLPARKMKWGKWETSSNQICMYYRHSDMMSMTTNNILDFTIALENGTTSSDHAVVTGVFDYKDMEIYTTLAMYGIVDLHYLNTLLLNTNSDIATELFVRMKDTSKISKLKKEIKSTFGNKYRFIQPQNSANLIKGIFTLTHFIIYAVAVILLLLVYLCSSFLINMVLESRRKEIGIYMAMGVRKWDIGKLFSGEFVVTAFVFGSIGIFLGSLVMNYLTSTGIEASIIPLLLVFGRKVLFIHYDWISILVVIVLLAITIISNTLSTVHKLNKIDPVDVMKDL